MSLGQFIFGSTVALAALVLDSDRILLGALVLLVAHSSYRFVKDVQRYRSRAKARILSATPRKVSFSDKSVIPGANNEDPSKRGSADIVKSDGGQDSPAPEVPAPEVLMPVDQESFEARREAYRRTLVVPGVTRLSDFDMRRQRLAENSLSELRTLINKEYGDDQAVLKFLTNTACYRFLRAREGNAEAAMRMIRTTVEWRRKNDMFNRKPECAVCMEQEPRAHAYFCMGTDVRDRAVMYSCSARAVDQKSVEAGMFHMVCEMEHFLNDDTGVAQIVWVVDFNGFKARHSNPELGRQSVTLFQQVYPERLGQLVLLDFPWLFSVFFKIVAPLIDPVTRSKITILRTPAEQEKYFEENWSPAMVSWIRQALRMPAGPGIYPESDTIRGRYWK